MKYKHLVASAAMVASLFGAAAATASTVIGTESSSTGFTGNIFASVSPGTLYMVSSDGEFSFHAFGASFDTSDGLDFSAVGFTWTQASDSHWTNIGSQIWVVPAVIPGCGAENSNTCEPVGHFLSPTPWTLSAIGTWQILESDGHTVSDVITTFNGANGAELTFGDPSVSGGVPEASTWALMLVGFGGLGAMLRRRTLSAVATA